MTSKKNIEKPILTIDTNNFNKAPETERTAPSKSRKKITLKEFSLYANLRKEHLAGFKIWLQGKTHAFRDEWEELLEQYKNRKLD